MPQSPTSLHGSWLRGRSPTSVCLYIYIYIYIYTHMYIYIYNREREIDMCLNAVAAQGGPSARSSSRHNIIYKYKRNEIQYGNTT